MIKLEFEKMVFGSIGRLGNNSRTTLNWATFLIMGLVFLNPFPHTTFIDQLLFYAALIPMLILMTRKYKLYYYSPLFYPLVLFCIWSMVTVFWALDKPDSLHVLYSHLIRYLLFYLVVINLFSTRKRLISLAACIVVSEVVLASTTLVYYYLILGHDLSSRFVLELTALATDVLPFGFITGILLAGWLINVCQNRYQKLFLFTAIQILLASIIATHSKGAFLALCISLPILFWNHKKVLILVLVSIMVVISLSPLKNRVYPDRLFDDPARMYLIHYSIEIIKDFPIWGTGFSMNTFRNHDVIDNDKYRSRVQEKYQHEKRRFNDPHNMFLSMGVRTGVVGMILYAGLFVVAIFTSGKLILFGKDMFIQSHAQCCLALLTMFLLNGVLQVVTTHYIDTILYIILSLVTIIWKINRDTESAEVAQ